MKLKTKIFLIASLTMFFTAELLAQKLRLDGGFTSNMVLQRDKDVRVFGVAPKNSVVTIKFGGQKTSVKVDDNGRFLATLKPMKANAKGQSMTVSDGKEKLTLTNILVGDVWLCGGQSNMEYNMGPIWRSGKTNKVMPPKKGENIQQQVLDETKAKGKSFCPMMRAIVIEKDLKQDTLPTTGWKELDGETIIPVSAVGYFFGKNMCDSLNVPVGLIVSCWGGTRIESWMNPEFSMQDETVNNFISRSDNKMDGEELGIRFNRMIRELSPMAMQGIIWYQGCSNLMAQNWSAYNKKEASLLKGWRKAFDDERLGFYYVQLAPYSYSVRRTSTQPNTWRDLANFRDLQILPQEEFPLTGEACTVDLCDNVSDIHPTYKWEVGRRLALQALNKQFGRKDIVCDGPRCVNTELQGNDMVCTFDQELTTNDGKDPRCFVLSDGRGWYGAEAKIDGNKVLLHSKKMKTKPTKVFYAGDEANVTNLCNKQGLPALPF